VININYINNKYLYCDWRLPTWDCSFLVKRIHYNKNILYLKTCSMDLSEISNPYFKLRFIRKINPTEQQARIYFLINQELNDKH